MPRSSLYNKSEWRAFRNGVIDLDNYKCKDCSRGSNEVILQVHHKQYILGRKPWEYALKDCETLCRGCHSARHGITVPQIGWEFLGEEDLGDLNGVCENCGASIRHCFLIQHPKWGAMEVGTICCDKLTDSNIASNLIESQTSLRSREHRFISSRRWRLFEGRYIIIQSSFSIEIEYKNKGFYIRIHKLQSKVKYDTLESAKQKVFDVIESGEFIEYLNRHRIPFSDIKAVVKKKKKLNSNTVTLTKRLKMDKEKRIEKYIYDFFSTRFETLDIFYRTTYRDRETGVYQLKDGPKIMDLIITIHSHVRENYYAKELIPQRFATPDALFNHFAWFKTYLGENQKLLDKNRRGHNVSYIVTETQKFINEIIQMIDYAKAIYDKENTPVPYEELRYKLIVRNIPDFINILKSILSSVSFAIAKIQEGYFHSNVHLILKLLGFEIISEEQTNRGRIDAVIRFTDTIYIIEFKFGLEKDLSKDALRQITEKDYASKFFLEHKEIYGVGISFDEKSRNINGYSFARL